MNAFETILDSLRSHESNEILLTDAIQLRTRRLWRGRLPASDFSALLKALRESERLEQLECTEGFLECLTQTEVQKMFRTIGRISNLKCFRLSGESIALNVLEDIVSNVGTLKEIDVQCHIRLKGDSTTTESERVDAFTELLAESNLRTIRWVTTYGTQHRYKCALLDKERLEVAEVDNDSESQTEDAIELPNADSLLRFLQKIPRLCCLRLRGKNVPLSVVRDAIGSALLVDEIDIRCQIAHQQCQTLAREGTALADLLAESSVRILRWKSDYRTHHHGKTEFLDDFIRGLAKCQKLEKVVFDTVSQPLVKDAVQWMKAIPSLLSFRLSCLRYIRFHRGVVPLHVLKHFVARNAQHLREIDVSCQIALKSRRSSEKDVTLLAGLLALSNLRVFRWSSNFGQDYRTSTLFDIIARALTKCDSLETVDIQNRAAGPLSNYAVVSLMAVPSLRTFKVDGISDWTSMAEVLGRSNCGLKRLELTRDGSHIKGAVALADALGSNSTLAELVLRGSFDGDFDLAYIGRALKANRTLRKLSIQHYFISRDDSQLPQIEEILQAFIETARVNFDLRLYIVFRGYFTERASRIIPLVRELYVEVLLNKIGRRGKLLREDSCLQDWIDAFVRINSKQKGKSNRQSDQMCNWHCLANAKKDIEWDCLYLLLRSNPSLCSRL